MHRKEADIEQWAGPRGLQDLLQQQPRRDLGLGPFAPGIHGGEPGGGDRLNLSRGEQAMTGLGGIQAAIGVAGKRIAIAKAIPKPIPVQQVPAPAMAGLEDAAARQLLPRQVVDLPWHGNGGYRGHTLLRSPGLHCPLVGADDHPGQALMAQAPTHLAGQIRMQPAVEAAGYAAQKVADPQQPGMGPAQPMLPTPVRAPASAQIKGPIGLPIPLQPRRMPKGGCRQGLDREVEIGGEALAVGGTRTGADMAHKIPAGPERKGSLLPAGQQPAIKPGIGLAQGDELLHHLLPIGLLIAAAEGTGERRGLTEGRPVPIAAVAQLPAAPPGGPTPGIGVASSPVISPLAAGDGSTRGRLKELRPVDAPHPRVVAVALQQSGAVREEVGMGNAIVLQDDALLHLIEKPGDGAAHPQAAALVHVGIEPLDLAWPVDLLLDHMEGGGHLLGFARALGIRAVAGHIQARGGHRTDGIDHLTQGVGATPGD
jgi:hypothetical protein